MTEQKYTPGRIAYEADVRARPTYSNGKPRQTWDEIGDIARASWERNPTPLAGTDDPAALLREVRRQITELRRAGTYLLASHAEKAVLPEAERRFVAALDDARALLDKLPKE